MYRTLVWCKMMVKISFDYCIIIIIIFSEYFLWRKKTTLLFISRLLDYQCNCLESSFIFFVVKLRCNRWLLESLSGEGNGTPLQYSCLENPVDGGAWWAAVHGVARSQTRLSDFTLTSHFPALEKEMATHSSVLAWRIPGTGQLGGLPSLGSHRVGHDWSDLAAVAADITSCGGRGKLVLWCTLYKGSAIMA